MSETLSLLTRKGDRIVITHGLHTPFACQAMVLHGISVLELGRMIISELLARGEILQRR
ncbi:hypothetical protein LU604_07350 [Erwinia tracheiphila]|nr:3-ketoacyl-CoA thiolase [Erwinia tracheiphila]EOS96178.1 3-ketoacyl-CoA thiolase [Erwinia tracheiphila PSU-1]UIA84739.1 hypothetical protein LU604_07350 [Erwinia tracheiphila]UIA93331.1 hypothetical protein LU632_07315 [Erwinia tracheiphila]